MGICVLSIERKLFTLAMVLSLAHGSELRGSDVYCKQNYLGLKKKKISIRVGRVFEWPLLGFFSFFFFLFIYVVSFIRIT